ncbi:zinc finger BED domain-containing protein RICESLEEPER 2-like [Nicotiana tomentosiformis]|uniref:zinc finger BED domain-containing protein RICESLEEPER 2-like n=1 Tax=Nicotiana tomentosiformis TaxID=4098 RepID=UPI00388C7892
MEKVKIIKERLKTTQSHQKSNSDVCRRDLEFKEDDWVFLKVSPMKGVMRFGKKGKLSPSHKGEDIANGIGRCLREWGINKIFTVTVDNASSNDVTVKELSKQLTKMGTNLMNGNHFHVRCMAHIMNLVVQDSLKESSVSIERVRHAVRYVRQSPARLKRVVKFESAFSHFTSREIGLRHYLEHSYIEVEIPTVVVYLKQLIANQDTILSEMAKKMKEKFDKYWGDLGKMNKIIFISCILDPRYKLESVGYALVKMFGQDMGATIQVEVKKYMTPLFSEYVKSSSKGVVLASSLDCSSLDTSTSGLSGSQFVIFLNSKKSVQMILLMYYVVHFSIPYHPLECSMRR